MRKLIEGSVPVAVKVQYPGVSTSIDSDLNSLRTLVKYLNILPKSFFLDEFVRNTRRELKEECDYQLEAAKQTLYREMVARWSDPTLLKVPRVIGRSDFFDVRRTQVPNGSSHRVCHWC